MGKKARNFALLGLIGGVSQGINQAAADRRAASLYEIQQRYRQAEKAADREFQTQQEETRFQNNMKVAEKTHELNSQPDWNDPKNRKGWTGDSYAAAAEANDPSLLVADPLSSKDKMSAGLADTMWYEGATPAQRAIYDRVNKITDKGEVLTPKEKDKAVIALYTNFEKLEPYDKNAALKALGVDPALKGNAQRDAVISAYRSTIDQIATTAPAAPTGGSIPLVEEQPTTQEQPGQWDTEIQQAREAIAANRDPEAVKNMLRQMGVPESLIGNL